MKTNVYKTVFILLTLLPFPGYPQGSTRDWKGELNNQTSIVDMMKLASDRALEAERQTKCPEWKIFYQKMSDFYLCSRDAAAGKNNGSCQQPQPPARPCENTGSGNSAPLQSNTTASPPSKGEKLTLGAVELFGNKMRLDELADGAAIDQWNLKNSLDEISNNNKRWIEELSNVNTNINQPSLNSLTFDWKSDLDTSSHSLPDRAGFLKTPGSLSSQDLRNELQAFQFYKWAENATYEHLVNTSSSLPGATKTLPAYLNEIEHFLDQSEQRLGNITPRTHFLRTAVGAKKIHMDLLSANELFLTNSESSGLVLRSLHEKTDTLEQALQTYFSIADSSDQRYSNALDLKLAISNLTKELDKASSLTEKMQENETEIARLRIELTNHNANARRKIKRARFLAYFSIPLGAGATYAFAKHQEYSSQGYWDLDEFEWKQNESVTMKNLAIAGATLSLGSLVTGIVAAKVSRKRQTRKALEIERQISEKMTGAPYFRVEPVINVHPEKTTAGLVFKF